MGTTGGLFNGDVFDLLDGECDTVVIYVLGSWAFVIPRLGQGERGCVTLTGIREFHLHEWGSPGPRASQTRERFPKGLRTAKPGGCP